MKEFKKLTSVLLSLATAAAMMLPLGLNASAAVINYKWTVDRSSPDPYQRTGWKGNGKTNFSVDNTVHTDNSWYSIKLENTDYNISYVERTYNVEPNTYYKFSAMVKYSGYQLAADAKASASGGCVGEAYTWHNSGYTVSNDWRLMEYEFTTKPGQTTINLNLQNGIYNGLCKGTAWFSDVKLEKAKLTNNWDILAVFIKNVDATVSLNGEMVHHKMTFTEIDDVNTYRLDCLPSAFKELSHNQLNINKIDRYIADVTLTEKDLTPRYYQDTAKTIPSGYMIDYNNSKVLSSVLDPYLAQKNYNQILVFVPLHGINGAWWGLGGNQYKGVYFAQFTNSWEGAFRKSEFHSGLVMHEMLHGMEYASKAIDKSTPDLHSGEEYMKKYPELGIDTTLREFYHLYMTKGLPDGKGLDPSVFYRPNGKYTLIDNSMETGVGITPGSDSVTPPAPKNLTVKPAEGSTDKVHVSWDAVSGAEGYQLTLFKDPDHKEVLKNFDYKIGKTSTSLSPITKGKPYYYGIRAKYTQNGKTVYSDWTYLTYTFTGSNVTYGDIDGVFDVNDIVALIGMILNGSVTDHAYEAMGEAKGTGLNVNHAVMLIQKCLNG